MNLKEESLKLHSLNKGKLEIKSKVKIENQKDLSLAYTPGVAYVCKEIEKNPQEAYTYTSKGNMVAVISDGSTGLGLSIARLLTKKWAGVSQLPGTMNIL